MLKAIKYPEISYRKFCGDDKTYKGYKANGDYMGMDKKQNRAFIGLPFNRRQIISHVQLSQFRSSLTFTQLVNLTVYILYHLCQNCLLDAPMLHCVDSTELAVDNQRLLATLVRLGKAIGLDVKLITADEAYHDNDGAIFEENGVYLVTPPSSKVSLPENVDRETLHVRLEDQCEIPMQYVGIEEKEHEFKCGAEPGQCHRACICPQFCQIPFDNS